MNAAIASILLLAVVAQPPTRDDLIRANAYPFKIVDGVLAGPGADLIAKSSEDKEFVALGEEHNRAGVHAFGGALFRHLATQRGFQYLALEEDPYVGRLLSASARSGGRSAVIELARRYPNAFHMYTESEFEMIADAANVSNARSDPIWGLNQVFGAMHIYERLMALAPDAAARAAAERLRDQAREYEGERFQKNVSYMSTVARPEDFAELRKAFHPAAGSEAEFLIEQMALSNRIFAPYVTKPSPAAEAFYESGARREWNMKQLFAEDLRRAQKNGDPNPKVMVMLGQLHLYRGLSERTDLYTLGNFLSELATFEGMQSLHIYSTVNTDFEFKSPRAPLARAALAVLGESSGVVIDLRPLVQLARHDSTLDPQLRHLILAFDFYVLLKNAEQGSYEHLRTPHFRWYPSE